MKKICSSNFSLSFQNFKFFFNFNSSYDYVLSFQGAIFLIFGDVEGEYSKVRRRVHCLYKGCPFLMTSTLASSEHCDRAQMWGNGGGHALWCVPIEILAFFVPLSLHVPIQPMFYSCTQLCHFVMASMGL